MHRWAWQRKLEQVVEASLEQVAVKRGKEGGKEGKRETKRERERMKANYRKRILLRGSERE